ncbi:MAG TPA: OmpA family protein [Burkholderiales bacterium]|nr:OmpA family protein [Burkholderiales bacterium]
MRFTLQLPVRQLALVFPTLLVTALPVAIGANPEQPGVSLPAASLYDARPAEPTVLGSVPAQTAPSAAVPALPTPPVAAPTAAVSPAPVAAPAAASSAPQVAQQAATPPADPWYRRWFSWLPWNSSKKSATEASAASQPQGTPSAQAEAATVAPSARSQYAYDASNRGIRAGATGQCVRMGASSLEVPTGECQAQQSQQLSAAKAPATAPAPLAPVVVTAAPKPPPPTMVAVAQPAKQLGAGSGPAPMPVSQPRPEPVYVVPLPPAPPAAKEERALEPVEPRSLSHDETIAALSETPMMREPESDKLSFSSGALFPLGSNKIKPAGQEKLDELVEQLRGMRYEKIVVVGHTDPTGSKAMNEKLSKRRADAVRAYLVAKGVDAKRIQTEGKGGADPLPKTQDCDGLPRMDKIACYAPDRRVDVEVVGSKSQGSASAGLSPNPRS